MKIAHLIMAHKNPEQLGRLLSALQHDDFYFFIHLDSKCELKDYEHLATRPRVEFTARRFAVRWASYRFTHAILECTRDILAGGRQFAFINLLSGQDYPIKPAATIHDFFARHKGYSFLSFESEGSPWWQHATSRIEKYHTTYFRFKGQYLLQRFLNLVLPRRRFPLPYALYGGADGSWWTLDTACAAYLVHFVDEHPKLRWFSMFTWGSDEFLIATILMNSPFKSSIINENYRYIDWSAGGANPKLLLADDFPKLAHAHKLFARKFDADFDHSILNLVDGWLVRHYPRSVAAG
ncbi:beta-1,6-N-acetylglucosaminyltransferase [Hymenobacter cheonanensis]|uniref:beta-1,6-N-acetylglucosaminyltransferase n=1 Tax=Hymenobacter sp. CA2-7 TaxID=3063993 RepID=UPI0027131187|nr:beta-1,6-N-acetylglucosaminyltransferase [Hymenobacter sp. CA2-7]MDO7887383.1 beta-1,6-N-acetylglucosaminyltransferase [Hymenobacter sp. CA2-7]